LDNCKTVVFLFFGERGIFAETQGARARALPSAALPAAWRIPAPQAQDGRAPMPLRKKLVSAQKNYADRQNGVMEVFGFN